MAASTATVPALLSAFSFGIIVNAASASLLIHINTHGASILRDGQRLVLAMFLLSATVWAVTAFISTAIDTTATTSCQIGIVFSTLFDQLARFSVEQYLLWALHRGSTQPRLWQLIPQALLLARFVLSAVFVGFSRPSFAPVCVPASSMLPIAVVVVALDAIFIAAFVIRAFTTGLVADARNGLATSARSKSVLLAIVAFAIWTATSVVMLLGIKGTTLLLRTLLPAVGLFLLLAVVTIRNDALSASFERPPQAPDSPGVPAERNISTGRSIMSEDSSEDASSYPPRRFEDLKRADLAALASEQPRSAPRPAVPSQATTTAGNGNTALLPPPPTPSLTSQSNEFASISVRSHTDVPMVTVRPPAAKAKRSFFDRKGSSNSSAPKISKISNPILQQNGDGNPLNKIPTISLEDALRSERERRENTRQQDDLQRESALIAKRPAPRPPILSPEEAIQRSVSLKRKQVPLNPSSLSPQPPMPSNGEMESMPSMASTSSTQLSPGLEELRRRSPRQLPADRPWSRLPGSAVSRPPPPVPSPTIALPSSVRIAIRPSRQLPRDDNNSSPPEAPKTALQRRPTNGLPGNPRAMAIEMLAKEAAAGRQQTVLFVNDIVYDSPETVQGIIDDANMKGHQRFSTQSIVHRPRPIPRQNEKDRAIFPAERSPGHRRNKSGNSSGVRKSALLHSNPGSPTHLPPLPPPPKEFLQPETDRPNGDRPHPNDTKSMTFDEKMTLFFPTPPNVAIPGGAQAERRSSVPDLPPMPLDYMPLVLSPVDGFDATTNRTSQTTTRTTRTSVKTESIFEVDDMHRRNLKMGRVERMDLLHPMDRVQTASQHRSAADDVGNSWLPGIAYDSLVLNGISSPATGGRKRASSPILPLTRDSMLSASTNSQTHDDITTNWGSVHSPVVAMPASRLVARTMYINGERSADTAQKSSSSAAASAANNSSDNDDNNDNASAAEYPLLPSTTYKDETREPQWHRRVGDECPTFSGRKESALSRKLPPPSPLHLQPASTRNPVIVKAAEPSPLDSPERALAYIQAQLKRYEEPAVTGTTETPGRRMALLDNLEKEMDVQASHWKDMQQDLRHDSLSSIQTISTMAGGSHRHSGHSTRDLVRDSARLLRVQGGNWAFAGGRLAPPASKTPLRNSMTDLGSPTPPDSDDSDVEQALSRPRTIVAALSASLVEDREKTVAKDEKMLWTPSATNKLLKNTTAMLWSADAATTRVFPLTAGYAAVQLPSPGSVRSRRGWTLSAPLEIESSALWTGKPSLPQYGHGGHGLWTQPSSYEHHMTTPAVQEALSSDEPPKLPLQQVQTPAQTEVQKTQWRLEELELEMTAMEEDRPRVSMSMQQQKPPRPITQRPPRRSRRVTLLPDIVENPEPLPNKRGTLGIFRFPWGERSDTVALPPTRSITGSFMAMPGTMASGGGQLRAAHEARSRQLQEEEGGEVTSSFFEDYDDDGDDNDAGDEEDGGEDADSDSFGSDSDDGFDENTLWEIASLLKTEQVPSTLSMFPPPFPTLSVVDDYLADLPSDDETANYGVVLDYDGGESIEVDEIVVGLDMDYDRRQPLHQEKGNTMLWTPRTKMTTTIQTAMLFSKEAMEEEATARAVIRTTDQEPAALHMPRTLHMTDRAPLPTLTSSHLWTGPTSGRGRTTQLWVAVPKPEHVRMAGGGGLFDRDVAAMERLQLPVRTTDQEPAALHMPRRLHAFSREPLAKLTSAHLWTASASGRGRTAQLWVPSPPSAIVRAKSPLFDREAAAMEKLRAPVRTTSQEPAALHMPRRLRTPHRAPLPQLESSHLWSESVRGHKGTVVQRLWTSPAILAPTIVHAKIFLFDQDVAAMEKRRKPTRTTSAQPIGIHMGQRAPRAQPRLHSLELTSRTLWRSSMSGKQSATLQRNWILSGGSSNKEVKAPFVPKEDNIGVASKQPVWWERMQTGAPAGSERVPRRRASQSATADAWAAALQEAVARSYPTDVSEV